MRLPEPRGDCAVTLDRLRREEGSVTAEAAIVLPLIALFALSLFWMVAVVIAHVQAIDAARDAAREVARGSAVAEASTRARVTTRPDAQVEINEHDGLATVTVAFTMDAPGWLIAPWPDVHVQATSTVAVEDDRGQ